MSPPSRWCGLKSIAEKALPAIEEVTTFAVVWIEIVTRGQLILQRGVTTFAVVWIEILKLAHQTVPGWSPPSRWCGLKLL